jgi:acetyl-CoA C-acetyltransferase
MDFFEGHYLNDAMLVDYTGAHMKKGLKINTGGTVGSTEVIAGFYNVASGISDTCLVIGWEKHDEAPVTSAISTIGDSCLDRPFIVGALTGLAIEGIEYMHRSGCTLEHAAMVRAQASENAARNPKAHLRDRYSVADVLAARMVLYPLNLLLVCPTSVGATAMVLAGEKKAKKICKKPVWIKDHTTSHSEYTGNHYQGQFDLPGYPRHTSQMAAGSRLLKRNHITQPMKDIQVFEMYDPCAFVQMSWLEDFGICGRSEGWKLVEKGVTALEGAFPVNPSGGVLCTNAIGDSGAMRVAEAALQIRGDAGEHQVTRDVKRALASGFGGAFWTDLLLLGRDME